MHLIEGQLIFRLVTERTLRHSEGVLTVYVIACPFHELGEYSFSALVVIYIFVSTTCSLVYDHRFPEFSDFLVRCRSNHSALHR